jgi:hypothetical protein
METVKRTDAGKTVSLIETVYQKTVLYLMSLISIYNHLFRRGMMNFRSVVGSSRVPSTAIPPGGI